MTRTPLDGRPLRDRLLDAVAAPATGEPTTDLQKAAYADGQALHADGSTRPNDQMAAAIYGDEGPWLVRGWRDAAAMADSQTTWDRGLSASGIPTGEHVDDDGTRHVATRELYTDATGRPDYWSWSCSCGTRGQSHRSSTLTDAAFPAAREWAAHLPAVEPATFTCTECGDEEHALVAGDDDSLWCVCDARLDEQRDRIARDSHDFETQGRQSERTVTPCAGCGLDRSAAVHR